MFDHLLLLRLIAFSEKAECAPVSFPVFLKQGFSTVLEFESVPDKVVIGDRENFQVERMGKSLAIRPLVPEASTNLLVYFAKEEPKLLLLTASDQAEPLLYKKFERPPLPANPLSAPRVVKATRRMVTKIVSAKFTEKHDFLIVNVVLAAPLERLVPDWAAAHLTTKKGELKAGSLWAERKEIALGTSVTARFIFPKPDIPEDLAGVNLVIPANGGQKTFTLKI